MKKQTLILLPAIFSLVTIFTACDHYRDNDENNAKLHQEILPKGQKSDLDTISTLTIGEQDSLSNNPPK